MNIRPQGASVATCSCHWPTHKDSSISLPLEEWNIDCVYTLCNNPAIDAMLNKTVFQLGCLHGLLVLFHSYSRLQATEQTQLMRLHSHYVTTWASLQTSNCIPFLPLWHGLVAICEQMANDWTSIHCNLNSRMVEQVLDKWSHVLQH